MLVLLICKRWLVFVFVMMPVKPLVSDNRRPVLSYRLFTSGLSLDLINKPMTKGAISQAINRCYRQVGLKETVIFADQLMYMGFHYATVAGVSIGVNDSKSLMKRLVSLMLRT